KCGKSIPELKVVCAECQKGSNYHFTRSWATCHYDGVLRECIHTLKYRGKVHLARPLGQLMADFAKDHLNEISMDMIIPVPLHSSKKREREFNQAELLSRGVSKALHLPIVTNNLKRIRPTQPQSNLDSKEERLANIRDAFKLTSPPKLTGKSILLIDDLFTSGSTVNECSRTLLDGGAQEVVVLALARG
ncbi:MAG: ComF family protein, partial [Candidatus Omnitrophica bacterium]|nr:ComF family protein [Candidatus Omnitrophota bacterium]